jgi:Domain of unknown function (DU1801)
MPVFRTTIGRWPSENLEFAYEQEAAMAEPKTKPTDLSVETFLITVADEARRADCFKVMKLMQKITKAKAAMWGAAIVGFGSYHYRYASGQEGDWPLTGFSPRKQNLTIYIMSGFEQHVDLMNRLGKYKTGKSCLYLKQLEDVDLGILSKLIDQSVRYMRAKYPAK